MSLFGFLNENLTVSSSNEYADISFDRIKKNVFLVSAYLNKYKRIILSEENSYLWMIVFLSALYAGKELHVLDANADLKKMIAKIKPDIIITKQKCNSFFGVKSSNEMLNECQPNHFINENVDNSTVFLYTTGTTHESKSIKFSAQQILISAKNQGTYLGITSNDDVVLLPPFSHAYGLSAMLSSLTCGRNISIISNPIELLKVIQVKKIDVLFIPPIFLKVLMNNESCLHKLKSVRMIAIAGSKLDDDVYEYYRCNGVNILNIYGSTESGTCYIAASHIGEDKDVLYLSEMMKMRIIDGELLVQGENIGQLVNKKSELFDADGWYHTGDLVEENLDGSFRVVGRKKLIFVMDNGYKVKIEQLEDQIKKILSVAECQIILNKQNNLDKLTLVLEGEKSTSVDEVNRNLQYYERIYNIKCVKKIKKKRGKKIRMNRDRIISIVNEIAKEIKGSDYHIANMDKNIPFFDALGFDSLSSLQFVVSLEDRLNIKIDFQTFDPLCNCEQMINYISELIIIEDGE